MRCSNQLSYIAENCGRIILTFNTHVKHNFKKFEKWAYKPGSVEDDHSSRRTITRTLKRPTRIQHGPCLRIPIWSCFWWGLPCRELLPDTRCALTAPFHPYLSYLASLYSREERRDWRSTLCCTCRRLSPPRRYLAPCPMKPGLSSPVSVTETSTAATVRPTSWRILSKFAVNCSYFFAQLIFCISPSDHHAIRHVEDRAEYNQRGKTTDTVVDHDDQCILYRVQDQSHKSAHPYRWLHWDIQVHRHHS